MTMPTALESNPRTGADRPRILCVDDEPAILEGMSLHLRRRYDVLTAPSGSAALEILRNDTSIAVIVSDMRMPGMDGATFLAEARVLRPDSTRILLTGHADMESAIAAVNKGGIFRFLTKPCAPAMFQAALESALEQHRLVTGERVLLEKTLHGSIKALTDVLALTSPMSFGRANRITQCVKGIVSTPGVGETWQVEVAAMLSQIGCVILPEEILLKVSSGEPLSEAERKIADRLPIVTEQILGSIPRLEVVRAILAAQNTPFKELQTTQVGPAKEIIIRGAQVLTLATEYDTLQVRGHTEAQALEQLRSRGHLYDPAVLEALATHSSSRSTGSSIHEVGIPGLRAGMVLLDDVRLRNGILIITRGFEVTAGFIERLMNFDPGSVNVPIRVRITT
jgi:response regulator RpfG family c-di-GMP phosphodiesterase